MLNTPTTTHNHTQNTMTHQSSFSFFGTTTHSPRHTPRPTHTHMHHNDVQRVKKKDMKRSGIPVAPKLPSTLHLSSHVHHSDESQAQRGLRGDNGSPKKKDRNCARAVAVLIAFPGQLAFGTRPGLGKSVVQEKGPTRRSREQLRSSGNLHLTVFPCLHKVLTENQTNCPCWSTRKMFVDVAFTLRHPHVSCHVNRMSINNRSSFIFSCSWGLDESLQELATSPLPS